MLRKGHKYFKTSLEKLQIVLHLNFLRTCKVALSEITVLVYMYAVRPSELR